MDDRKYYLPQKEAERTKSAVLRKEKYYQFPPRDARRPRQVVPLGVVPVKLPSTAIAAGTPASPTSGTGHLYLPTTVGSPGLTADAANITLYNTFATATPTGGKMAFATFKFGFYYLTSWDC